MTKVKIDDSWYVIDDPVANRMVETARDLLEAHKEISRLKGLLEKEIRAVTYTLPNDPNYNWKKYCKENNITF